MVLWPAVSPAGALPMTAAMAPGASLQTRRPRVLLYFADFGRFWGIESFIINLALNLRRNGRYDPVIMASAGSAFASRVAEAGLPYVGIPTPARLRKPFWRLAYPPSLWALLAQLRAIRPDIVHVQGGRIENLLFKLLGYTVVYTFHGYAFHLNRREGETPLARLKTNLTLPLFRAMARRIDRLVFVSAAEQQRVIRQGFLDPRDAGSVVHNGLPVQAIREQSRQGDPVAIHQALGIPEGAACVGWVNTFDGNKNPLVFLALAEFIVSQPDLAHTHFIVAGDGALRQAFLTALADSPAADRVHYLGYRSDIPQLMAACDLVVNVAQLEAFGLMILECMACGTIPVTYGAGGIPEILPPEEFAALLAPVGDQPALAERIAGVLRMGAAEKQHLRERLWQRVQEFDHSLFTANMETVYADVLAQ